jgi:hypothetical protein
MPKCKDKIRVHCDVSYHGEVESVKLYRGDVGENAYFMSSANVGMEEIISALIDIIVDMCRMNTD